MYSDNVIADLKPPSFQNRIFGKGNERYSRQVDELDYIVPRGGYYFEHDDRDVWKPTRGSQQQGGGNFRPPPVRNADRGYSSPHVEGRAQRYNSHRSSGSYDRAPRNGDRDRYDSRAPVMSRIGNANNRAMQPSAERPAQPRERERSPVDRYKTRPEHEREAERQRPEKGAARTRPRSTIRSQVYSDAKVSSSPAEEPSRGAAPRLEMRAAREADGEAVRAGHADAMARRDGQAATEAAPDQRQLSAARADRGREPSGTPRRLSGRITSQVVGYDRPQEREQPTNGVQQQGREEVGRAGSIASSARFVGRLGGTAPPEHSKQRPWGGMRADAAGKWGHDMFEEVNNEAEERSSLLQKSILF